VESFDIVDCARHVDPEVGTIGEPDVDLSPVMMPGLILGR
jgi:hypothetical protein